MSLALGMALYFIIWWIVLFAVMPFNVRTQDEAGEVVPGTPGSAPANPRILRISYAFTAAKPSPFGPTCVPMTGVTFIIRISRGMDWLTSPII